jgi:tRNA pseudouridine13 synthase
MPRVWKSATEPYTPRVDLAYLTEDLPGTGGRLRVVPEDFRVDEIPLYLPGGEGEHLYMKVWKRGIATFEAARRLAAGLDVPERHVSYAGLKDARAVTTQWMSVPASAADRLEGFVDRRMKILEHSLHSNKLKLGHLRGNRFRIVVRDTEPEPAARAARILDVIVRRGVPNYFGEQRFGVRLNGHLCGEALVRRDYEGFCRQLVGSESELEGDERLRLARRLYDEGRLEEAYEAMPVRQRAEKKCLHALLRFKDFERACNAVPKRMRQMFASAFQSEMFNRIAEGRIHALDSIEAGDLAYLHRNGAVFRVEDLEQEQRRCRAFEISASAPLFGTHSLLAEGRPGEIERSVLAATGLTEVDFGVGGGIRLKGHRRPLRVPAREVALERIDERSFAVTFALPAGSFATSTMREILKAEPGEDPGDRPRHMPHPE